VVLLGLPAPIERHTGNDDIKIARDLASVWETIEC
jgi:hypothetical protein